VSPHASCGRNRGAHRASFHRRSKGRVDAGGRPHAGVRRARRRRRSSILGHRRSVGSGFCDPLLLHQSFLLTSDRRAGAGRRVRGARPRSVSPLSSRHADPSATHRPQTPHSTGRPLFHARHTASWHAYKQAARRFPFTRRVGQPYWGSNPRPTDYESVYLHVCWRWCALARLPKHASTSVYCESCVGAVGGVSETCAYSAFTGRLAASVTRPERQ
jgi:hypothetical protein